MADDEHNMELVMPFVACKSQGGPFDDDAFVAGYRCGAVDALLAQPDTLTYDVYAREADIAQLDLVAMRRGFSVVITPDEDTDEWFHVEFKRVDG